MRRFIGLTVAAVALALAMAALPASRIATLNTPLVAASACESLASLKLPNTTITLAQTVAAGAFTPPPPANGRGGRGGGNANPYADVPAFCRVTATLTPSADSDIKMELWMPASGWNGKYQTAGNGGLCRQPRSERARHWRQAWLRDRGHRYRPHGRRRVDGRVS